MSGFRKLRLLAVLAIALGIVLLPATPASAHAVLIDSQPADGAALAVAPRVVVLNFSEDIAARFSSARLLDASGRPVAGARIDPGASGPRRLTLALPPLSEAVPLPAPGPPDGAENPGPSGATYGVAWRVLAEDDGHTTGGVVVFTVGNAARSPGGQALEALDSGGGAAPFDAVRRWLGLCLLAGLIGGLAFAAVVLRPPPPGAVAARFRVLSVASACGVGAAVVGLTDLPSADLLVGTRWGQLWLSREAVVVTLAVLAYALRPPLAQPASLALPTYTHHAHLALLTDAHRSPLALPTDTHRTPLALATDTHRTRLALPTDTHRSPLALPTDTHRRLELARWIAAATLSVLIVAFDALGGHAASAGSGLPVVAVAAHALTAYVWLGGLLALVVTATAPGGRALVRGVRGRFGALAAGSVGLVAATGLYSAGVEVGSVGGLTGTAYGRVLLVKVALVLVVGCLGLANAVRLRRPVSRRLLAAEAVAGVVLLLAVGVLVETPPSRVDVGRPAAPVPVGDSGAVQDIVVSVTVTPDRPGSNGFTVVAVSGRRPPPAPIDSVVLRLDGSGVVALREIEPGRYFGTADLQAGTVRATAVVSRAGKQLSVPLAWPVREPAPAPGKPANDLAPITNTAAIVLLALIALAALIHRPLGRLIMGLGRRFVRFGRPNPMINGVEAVDGAKGRERILEDV